MAKKAKVKVINESPTGRNEEFVDTRTKQKMTSAQFVKEIEKGNYGDDCYVIEQNGKKTPVSKPDVDQSNNLD